MRELVEAGRLGRKSGAGFYDVLGGLALVRRGELVARSHTTSASPIPCACASWDTLSHGSSASGRSSQRA